MGAWGRGGVWSWGRGGVGAWGCGVGAWGRLVVGCRGLWLGREVGRRACGGGVRLEREVWCPWGIKFTLHGFLSSCRANYMQCLGWDKLGSH
jgi:hypothetical protein